MPKESQHIVPRKEGWAVRGAGNRRDTVQVETQAEAIERGKAIAKSKKSELIVHGKDGRIRDRVSYGNDPFPPKG
ncbi:MAG TPA: DUF2188 domain-containing protein [Gemmatimonadota bacterium]|nr:DUF2188 domain-containing protein [Gemmatimonadota bacterium]